MSVTVSFPAAIPAFEVAEKIVFPSNRGGDYDIWMASPDGTDLEVLIALPEDQLAPRVSPDGTRVLFVSAFSDHRELLYRDLTSGQDHLLYSYNDTNANAEWYPDGKSIIVKIGGCGGDLYQVALDGTSQVLIAESGRQVVWGIDSPKTA